MKLFSKKKKNQTTLERLEKLNIPKHVAIIMDGNGRWANRRGMPRNVGHKFGAEKVTAISEFCSKIDGLDYLTLYAFSTENWKRPENEKKYLFTLLKRFMVKERKSLIKNNVRLKTIGDIDAFSDDVIAEINTNKEISTDFKNLTMVLALNYGSQQEILRATKQISSKIKAGTLSIDEIDIKTFENNLYLPEMPPVDLLIRTSGEIRISNYLLWQISYAELYITDICWPDFNENQLVNALEEYSKRNRRFGKAK
ncbi:MAG: di-trans,poly-cis-decaprenylcistransferase [Planctomycetes bacterium]|nr:di-trans,poly-cis-decaprenylcistransferase [Planctomycetota bacterium]